MKLKLLATFTFLVFNCFAQKQKEGVLLDRETKEPVEFVNIYNGSDYTVSNADGRFAFTSLNDSVRFYRVGYDKFKTTFEQLKDTVYLNKSVLELNEVIVTNEKTIWGKIKDSLSNNYVLKPFKEKFTLRSVLKRNDEIMRIQDLQGKLSRKTQLYPRGIQANKKDFEVELINMRKVGVDSYEKGPYMNFFSLQEMFLRFSSIGITSNTYDFIESTFNNENKMKLEFTDIADSTYQMKGYYIVNIDNYAIEEFVLNSTMIKPTYQKTKGARYATTNYSVQFFFTKKTESDLKHYLSSGKIEADVEIIPNDDSAKYTYSYSNFLNTSDNFSNIKVNSNVKENRELFSVKHPYDESYWNSQNQLLLTKEMQEFIAKMGSENKEFKVRSNMD